MSKDKDKAKDKPEADVAEGEDGAPAKKKLPMKLVIIGAAGAVLVLGGGGAAAMMLMGGHGGAKGKAEKKHETPKKDDAKKEGGKGAVSPISPGPDGVVFYTMPDILVNMQATDSRPVYLKLKLAFELPDRETADAIEPAAPRLNDMFQGFLRELRPEDLSGSEGSYQLRQEIQRRVNLVIAPAKVNAVLIQEMLIQ